MIRYGLLYVLIAIMGFCVTGCGHKNDPIIPHDALQILQNRIQQDIDGIRKESIEIANNSRRIQKKWEDTQTLLFEMIIHHPEETTRKAIAVYEELQKPKSSDS